ncbi:site-specific integrase [Cryobacterium sp. Y50]|uniref:site-specific integrase n=1 Tax=Cryobacterium sp. Y50 TaxID=2048286 RepID=UPI0011B0918D|nr:site-specific integrase [Cryobacterium sp. Y50]
MTNYQPQRATAEWKRSESFVKDACSLAAPHTTYTASMLLTVTSAFVLWCVRAQGWPLQTDVIFSRQAIDLYCTQESPERSEGTRRNYRAILMRVSEVVAPEEHPDAMTPLARKRVAEPYSAREMEEFSLWALGQVTAEKRRRAMLMLVLCAGAGLRPSDVSTIYPDDVVVDELGIVLTIHGTNPRTVPLLRPWEEWMVAILAQAPSDIPVWGKTNTTRASNLLSNFSQYTVGLRPRSDRLRATWIVAHLRAGTRIKELTRALGVEKFEHLPRYLEHVQTLDPPHYRAELRDAVSQ